MSDETLCGFLSEDTTPPRRCVLLKHDEGLAHYFTYTIPRTAPPRTIRVDLPELLAVLDALDDAVVYVSDDRSWLEAEWRERAAALRAALAEGDQ
jgi:hypothetical protein